MTATNFQMWPYWRKKYYRISDAIKNYFPEVLETETSLRLELIRIEAYEALIDKLIGELEESHEDDDGRYPMWRIHRNDYDYVSALERHYASELRKNEPLRVALQNIKEAEAAIDKWMTEKAAVEDQDDE